LWTIRQKYLWKARLEEVFNEMFDIPWLFRSLLARLCCSIYNTLPTLTSILLYP
jgi:hypothetical protein